MIEDQQDRITHRVSIGLSFLRHSSVLILPVSNPAWLLLHDCSIADHYHKYCWPLRRQLKLICASGSHFKPSDWLGSKDAGCL